MTKYTYYASGLLNTMQDPHLVALGSSYNYTYAYDTTGRKTSVTYPPDSGNVQRSDSWTYDTVGRIGTFTNRSGKVQTFTYDALNRVTGFSWNDGLTPGVSFGYDIASRLTSIVNANATINRLYYGDNTLYIETETIPGRNADTMTYTYDADGNRALAQWSGYVQNTYTYTGRNQLQTLVVDGSLVTTYGYDVNGNLTTRTPNNSTNCTYSYDALDRVTHIVHALHGTTRTFDYAYDAVGNREWTKRDGGTGDVFRYDLADQAIAVQLNVPNPDQVPQPIQWTIAYDASGNRTNFWPYGTTDVYTSNNLSQYTQRTRNGTPTSAVYDNNGNLTSGVDGSTYAYDAQNRLLSASTNGVTETFKYDALNRQVSRAVNGPPTYNVYDGWNLMGEYANGATSPSAGYVYGAGELVKNVVSGLYYYQDGSGSTSHVTGGGGYLFEWYRYDLQGTPVFYNSSNVQISGSNFGIRHLFAGQQWYSDIGLYDLRNRFYSPDIGRFLQPDPIGFNGDATNLYRYCANNPPIAFDPSGLNLTITLYPAGSLWHYNHIGIGVDSPFTKSYGPVHPGRPMDKGQVSKDNPKDAIVSITIPTDAKQDQAVRDYIADITAHPGIYTGWSNNCTRFVETALIEAKIENVPEVVLPDKLMGALRKRYGEGDRGSRRDTEPVRENRVGPVGFMPWGNPLGPGGYGPGPGSGPIGSGPLGGPVAPPDSGPATGPDSQPYVPGPIEPYWQNPDDVPEFDPFPENPADAYNPDYGSGLKND